MDNLPTMAEYEEAKRTNNLEVINLVIQHGVKQDGTEEETIEQDDFDIDNNTKIVGDSEGNQGDEEGENLSYSELVELENQKRIELEEQLAARDGEIARLKLLASEQKNMMANKSIPEYEPINPDDFDNDYDMLIEESRRMKDYIGKLKPGTAEASAAQTELNAVENKIESVTRPDDEAKQRRAIADEFSAFWRTHKELDPGVPFSKVQDTYIDMCEKVQQVFGVSDAEANIRLSNLFNKSTEKKTRELFEKNGITIPEGFDKIYESARVYDYMNGKVLNTTTGEYRDVMNRMGKVQTLSDMGTAYRLMNDKKLTLQKEREIYQKTQEFYNKVNKSGAREIPKDALSNIRNEDVRDISYLRSIISDSIKNPLKYKADAKLSEELSKAYKTISSM